MGKSLEKRVFEEQKEEKRVDQIPQRDISLPPLNVGGNTGINYNSTVPLPDLKENKESKPKRSSPLIRKFPCSACGRYFVNRQMLKTHIFWKHNTEST